MARKIIIKDKPHKEPDLDKLAHALMLLIRDRATQAARPKKEARRDDAR